MRLAPPSKLLLSLRGSLAGEAAQRMARSHDPQQAAEEYMRELISTREGDVMHYVDGSTLVIGRRSERGHFPPDW